VAAAKKPQIPTTIRIGHLVYLVSTGPEVNERLQDNGEAGRSNGNMVRIEVRDDFPRVTTRETLLHEVLHQCLFVAGKELPTELEEPIVRAMSMVLFGVLRDNPEFVQYLIKE
jgi:hypothetical protein